jgi:hypothetical protein
VNFSLVEFAALPRAATPTITATLRVDVADDEAIAALALRCQVQIEPARRTYSDAEAAALYPLFGTRAEFGRTVRSLLWTHADAVIPGFVGHAEVRLQLPCSTDLMIAATRLFAALEAGEVPLRLLFSGTCFKIVDGAVTTTPIPWTAELATAMPAALWRDVLDQHHPGVTFVPLPRDLVARLDAHRLARGLLTWDRALDDLLRTREGRS